MQVFWLRHGTRNFTTGDVPLNEEGVKQALKLTRNSHFSRIKKIFSSPKKRAQMTVEPLAKKYNLEINILEDLDQMTSHETEREFKDRVQNLVEKISQGDFERKSLLLCTHSDWLAMACQLVPTDAVDLDFKLFQCAEWIEFKIIEGIWKVQDSQ